MRGSIFVLAIAATAVSADLAQNPHYKRHHGDISSSNIAATPSVTPYNGATSVIAASTTSPCTDTTNSVSSSSVSSYDSATSRITASTTSSSCSSDSTTWTTPYQTTPYQTSIIGTLTVPTVGPSDTCTTSDSYTPTYTTPAVVTVTVCTLSPTSTGWLTYPTAGSGTGTLSSTWGYVNSTAATGTLNPPVPQPTSSRTSNGASHVAAGLGSVVLAGLIALLL